jgi:hypothetical protein
MGDRSASLAVSEPSTTLTGTDLYHWIALRRVSNGGVTKLGNRWRDHGHLIPDYVTNALTELHEGALVTLADPHPGGMARAALTDAGTARFEQLALGISAAQFMAAVSWADNITGGPFEPPKQST